MKFDLRMIAPLLASCLTLTLAFGCDQAQTPPAEATVSSTADSSADVSQPPSVTVYKTPTCGCCKKWSRHLENAGMRVTTIDLPDVGPLKAEHGVPSHLASCHTAIVDGYVVEGHVPAEDVLRLLDERPDIAGLAVPGMPIGSPGMEGPNPEHYVVLAFDARGATSPFASHGP